MDAGMDALVRFLAARLDEDEANARKLLRAAQDTSLTLKDPRLLGKVIPGWHDWPDVEAMCAARLREVATWRAILREYENPPVEHGTPRSGGFMAALGFALQAKAREYSGHPDWRFDGCWGRA